ncbi:MAG: hypothetical protein OEL20_04765 [Sulfuritalea sp.]|nr:hypothetical protein [Sulfuritalea sp.]
MGWNEGYTVMERTVVSLYDAGNLTVESLNAILEPYRGTDIDHGGCMELRTKDGKSADDVILSLLVPAEFERLRAIEKGLEADGINGESIYGLGDIPKGAKIYKLYGGALVIRDRRTYRGFRVTKTPEWEAGRDRLEDYNESYLDALDSVTGWA